MAATLSSSLSSRSGSRWPPLLADGAGNATAGLHEQLSSHMGAIRALKTTPQPWRQSIDAAMDGVPLPAERQGTPKSPICIIAGQSGISIKPSIRVPVPSSRIPLATSARPSPRQCPLVNHSGGYVQRAC